MIVKTIDDIRGTDREVSAESWVSYRFLLKKDGMGFSFHKTIVRAGTEIKVHYKNHLEAVYCLDGEGSIYDLGCDETHDLKPGTVYVLDKHDEHIFRAKSDISMICVFNPPLTGQEKHDEGGSYPLLEDG